MNMDISSFIIHHSSFPILQAFARLPENPQPPDADADDIYTGLLIIFIAAVILSGILGAVRARLAYHRGYRDAMWDVAAEELSQCAPEAPAVPVLPRAWRCRRH